ncbi:MAG: hypothetical protein ISS15_06665 [Alphaproteobacteria bacterium]|nr:hypothetical protein [Alphaproteobacteria bacterium]MBL7097320.1 hypothetical protein [Alphaproteobacteria bacterium]
MSNPPRDLSARKAAQSHFDAHEARTNLAKQIVQDESAANDAKTARLRALRLAKEEADRAAKVAAPEKLAPVKKSGKKIAP